MRLRTLGIGFVAVLVVVVFAGGATAAKPDLWLQTEYMSGVRAAAGEAAFVNLYVEEPRAEGSVSCELDASGQLLSNGEPVDKASFTAVAPVTCREQYAIKPSVVTEKVKVTGAIEGLEMTGGDTMTIKSSFHVLAAPWCVYTLPSKMTFNFGGSNGQVGAEIVASVKLDKSASFGTCTATHSYTIGVQVGSKVSGQYYWAEP
jgi:hypothetical protein